MKIHSIQFKFLATIISAMLAISFFVGGLSIYEVDNFIQRETKSFINVSCEKEAISVNDVFDHMENSVNIMSGYVLDYLDSKEDFMDRDKQNEVIEAADRIFGDIAECTESAVAYYIRFAPEISDSTTGFFYSKTEDSDEYICFELTDLSLYDKDDTEHVGWYWQPYEAGEPVWMRPYHNQNNDIVMISYVMPLYCEGEFIGVVGMDFDYRILTDLVHNIQIYENGFAHLELDGIAIPHVNKEIHAYDEEDYLQVSSELKNGMTLVFSASYDDIRQIRYEIGLRILCTVLVLTALFCLITIVMVRKIVKPLKELTDASKKLTNGNYDMEPIDSDTYEIKLLSIAFERMAMRLREHKRMQHLLAYRDLLTGLRNTNSYKVWLSDFDKEIQNKNVDFGVVIFDVNRLKETNDQFGHDVGNKLIIAAAQLISGIFQRSPVFRIGGDEFLVILRDVDLACHAELCKKFDSECANEWIEANGEMIPISIARGFSRYDSETDTKFLDVFNRADEIMYRHKRSMKSIQEKSAIDA